ncbi:chromosome partitioning protein ParB, partial [Blautia glucerasea]|nr:chromosome partitioning protein ParB [Blautia glucerasea]
VQIPAKKLKQYFPETYTKDQMEEIIFMLLASWAEREGKE